jgi:hypothetical protein
VHAETPLSAGPQDSSWLAVDIGGSDPTRRPRITLAGEIDTLSAPAVHKAVLDLLRRRLPRRIEIDLHRVTFLDSTGIRTFCGSPDCSTTSACPNDKPPAAADRTRRSSTAPSSSRASAETSTNPDAKSPGGAPPRHRPHDLERLFAPPAASARSSTSCCHPPASRAPRGPAAPRARRPDRADPRRGVHRVPTGSRARGDAEPAHPLRPPADQRLGSAP